LGCLRGRGLRRQHLFNVFLLTFVDYYGERFLFPGTLGGQINQQKQTTMKKNTVLFAFCAVLLTAFAVTSKSVVGRWTVAYGNGAHGYVVFRPDGTDEATFTGQDWKVGGQYKVEGNKVSIADSSCGLAYWGSYTPHWFSDDSVRMTVIEDTCAGRKSSCDESVMVRVK
jgi:hypothetical protein